MMRAGVSNGLHKFLYPCHNDHNSVFHDTDAWTSIYHLRYPVCSGREVVGRYDQAYLCDSNCHRRDHKDGRARICLEAQDRMDHGRGDDHDDVVSSARSKSPATRFPSSRSPLIFHLYRFLRFFYPANSPSSFRGLISPACRRFHLLSLVAVPMWASWSTNARAPDNHQAGVA